MNNTPFASFDLEESLSGLPASLRQPMVLAVGASAIVHGLFFVALPAVTTSTQAKKRPERVVNVIELTPEEQARLPQTMSLNQQFPLPTDALGKLPPLEGLLPGATTTPKLKSGSKSKPYSATSDPLLNSSIFNQPKSSSSIFPPLFRSRPVYRTVTPPTPVVKPEDKPVENKQPDEKQPDEKQPDEKQPDEKQPQTLPSVDPGQVVGGTSLPPGTPKASPSPSPTGKADDLNNTRPAKLSKEQLDRLARERGQNVEQQRQLIAATTYTAEGTTPEAQQKSQEQATNAVLAQLEPQLANLPEDQRNAIVRKIALSAISLAPAQPVTLTALTPQLPPGMDLKFGEANRPEQLMAVVQVYLDPQGKLLQINADENNPELLQVVRSSGFKYLDDAAKQAVEAELKKNPRQQDYQSVQFIVPFTLPQQATV